MSYFNKIAESFRLRKPKAYQPQFSIRKDSFGWRIYDRKKAIALFMPTALDIWSFSPFEPDIMANKEPARKIVDLHTLHNTYINLGMCGWPRHWVDMAEDHNGLVRWKWLKKKGARLQAQIQVRAQEGEEGQWLLSVSYDPRQGRYRFECDIAVRKLDPAGMEAFNMMMAGALTATKERRRWSHSIWENPDGVLRRIVHSNALFFATDFGGARDSGGPWRRRNLPYPAAWVGYAAHKTFNPVILIHSSTVPMTIATCSQLFDEHIIWQNAGQDNLGRDGYFHFHMSVEIVNVKHSLARQLLNKAKDPVKPEKWHHEDIALPLYMNKTNSFEKPVDPWKAEECPILVVPRGPKGPVQWANNVSHTGKRSIRLRAAQLHDRTVLFPGGAVCNVDYDSKYRLSGWIKTKGVKRFARLELSTYEYTYSNIIDCVASDHVSGSLEWTKVSVELDTGDEAYLMPRLVLYGTGTAWCDDIRLEKIKSRKA